jgi:hypothetical protein
MLVLACIRLVVVRLLVLVPLLRVDLPGHPASSRVLLPSATIHVAPAQMVGAGRSSSRGARMPRFLILQARGPDSPGEVTALTSLSQNDHRRRNASREHAQYT